MYSYELPHVPTRDVYFAAALTPRSGSGPSFIAALEYDRYQRLLAARFVQIAPSLLQKNREPPYFPAQYDVRDDSVIAAVCEFSNEPQHCHRGRKTPSAYISASLASEHSIPAIVVDIHQEALKEAMNVPRRAMSLSLLRGAARRRPRTLESVQLTFNRGGERAQQQSRILCEFGRFVLSDDTQFCGSRPYRAHRSGPRRSRRLSCFAHNDTPPAAQAS